MATARMPSASQTRSQANVEICWAASFAAARAVKPRKTCPQPETAVKAAVRSMVSRMKRRSAMAPGKTSVWVGEFESAGPCSARLCSAERRKRRTRWGRESNMRIE